MKNKKENLRSIISGLSIGKELSASEMGKVSGGVALGLIVCCTGVVPPPVEPPILPPLPPIGPTKPIGPPKPIV